MTSTNLLTKNCKIGEKYRIVKKIGEGSYGEVYEGIDVNTKDSVAIKVESLNTKHAVLSSERDVYHFLKEGAGVPTIKYYGKEKKCRALVMDLLGPNLQELFEGCSKRFSLKTILMIADQLLERIAFIHEKTFLHLDIKPQNILVGIKNNDHLLYIIDLGIAKNYMDARTKKHIPSKVLNHFIGTVKYMSLNANLGIQQSRRDDMMSIGYILIFFWKGKLPWDDVKAKNENQYYEKIIEKKYSIPTEELCEGMPEEFIVYIDYIKSLAFMDAPDYKTLRSLFKELYGKNAFENDNVFDWDLPIP